MDGWWLLVKLRRGVMYNDDGSSMGAWVVEGCPLTVFRPHSQSVSQGREKQRWCVGWFWEVEASCYSFEEVETWLVGSGLLSLAYPGPFWPSQR